MGFFDTVADGDLSAIPDDPFFLPEDTYTVKITGAKTALTARGDKTGLLINAMIIEGLFKGRNLIYWLYVPTEKTDDEEQQLKDQQAHSRLIKFFEAAGFGIDEMKGIKDAHLLNREQRWKTVNKKQDNETRISVVGIYPIDDADGVDMDKDVPDSDDEDYPKY